MAPPVLRCHPGRLTCPPSLPPPPARGLVHSGRPEFIDGQCFALKTLGSFGLSENTLPGGGVWICSFDSPFL